MQERRNSIANALELRLSCTNPSICESQLKFDWDVQRLSYFCSGSGIDLATTQQRGTVLDMLWFEQLSAKPPVANGQKLTQVSLFYICAMKNYVLYLHFLSSMVGPLRKTSQVCSES